MKKGLIIFLVMAILGAGAALIFAQKGANEGFGKMPFGGRGFERLAGKLNLTDVQKTEVKTILEDSQARVKPLMETMRENHKQAANLGTDGSFNEEQVNQIANAQAETMKQLFIEKEKTKAQIFAVLTPEQRAEAAKMKDAFTERFKKGGFKKRGGSEDFGGTEE